MIKKSYIYISMFVWCLFLFSCSDSLHEEDPQLKGEEKNISQVISRAKEEYALKYSNNRAFGEPIWDNPVTLLNNKDSILLSVPIKGSTWNIIVQQLDNTCSVLPVNPSSPIEEDMPLNRRKWINIHQGDNVTIGKFVYQKEKMKLVRLRIPNNNARMLNGGTFPDVVVWGNAYDLDWWYWDTVFGIINIDPPSYYGGYTGDENTPEQPPVKEYAKASVYTKTQQ